MTRSQVRYLLGTPLASDSFNKERWDYIYYLKKGRTRHVDSRRVTVYFDGEKVARLDKPSAGSGGGTGQASAAQDQERPDLLGCRQALARHCYGVAGRARPCGSLRERTYDSGRRRAWRTRARRAIFGSASSGRSISTRSRCSRTRWTSAILPKYPHRGAPDVDPAKAGSAAARRSASPTRGAGRHRITPLDRAPALRRTPRQPGLAAGTTGPSAVTTLP